MSQSVFAVIFALSMVSASAALSCVDNTESWFSIAHCGELQTRCIKLASGDATELKCATAVECGVGSVGEGLSNLLGGGGTQSESNVLDTIVGNNNKPLFASQCCDTDLCNNRIWFGTSLYITLPIIIVAFILFWVIFGCIIRCCCCR